MSNNQDISLFFNEFQKVKRKLLLKDQTQKFKKVYENKKD